eukprot:687700-Pyramimonas_sp.AAC.1
MVTDSGAFIELLRRPPKGACKLVCDGPAPQRMLVAPGRAPAPGAAEGYSARVSGLAAPQAVGWGFLGR